MPRRGRPARLLATRRRLRLAGGPACLAIFGLALSSDTLAVLGALGVLVVCTLDLWWSHCLDGLTYHRHLGAERARFGSTVTFELEVVNDKPLPLSYVRVEDELPDRLEIEGVRATVGLGARKLFTQVLPLSPYERVRRPFTIHCDRRGDHRFGPATITSGDPLGRRTRRTEVPGTTRLLVFPRIQAVTPEGIASRVFIGEARQRVFVTDPSRIGGVRPYVAGDPLRHVDWRATARTGEMLVRRFEPTVHHRVAVVLDALAPGGIGGTTTEETEFAISVAASLITELAERRVPVGLFATGFAANRPVAHPPSGAEGAYAKVMESLASLVPHGRLAFDEVVAASSAMTAGQTSFVLVAADFPDPVLRAAAEARRHHTVSAVWVATGYGRRPPNDQLDAVLTARFTDDWHLADALELSP